jgi:hypothetical protein
MVQWAESTIQDLRFALRSWGKARAFTVAAIATMPMGIGANTAIFSVVSGVLLRPLPFVDPQTLVQLYETQPRNSSIMGLMARWCSRISTNGERKASSLRGWSPTPTPPGIFKKLASRNKC